MTTTAPCTCENHSDGRTWARDCPEHGEAAMKARMVPVGTRIRHRRHPELTGTIACLEWTAPGKLSPIPYNIAWDDSSRAADTLGWFFIYGDPDSVERTS